MSADLAIPPAIPQAPVPNAPVSEAPVSVPLYARFARRLNAMFIDWVLALVVIFGALALARTADSLVSTAHNSKAVHVLRGGTSLPSPPERFLPCIQRSLW